MIAAARVARRCRVRQVHVRVDARRHLRDADGLRTSSGDGPRRRARQVRARRSCSSTCSRSSCCGRRGRSTLLIVTANLLDPHRDVRVACYLIGGSLVFRSYMLTIRGVLQGLEHFGWDLIVAIADRGLLLAFGAVGCSGRGRAFAASRSRSSSRARPRSLLAAAVTHVRLGGVGLRYDRDVWYDLHKTALPLGFFLIVLNLYSYVDSVMLGSMRTFGETGLYGAAYKIYEGFTYGALALSAVLTPRLSALFTTDRARHRRVALGGVAASAALGTAVAFVAFIIATPLLVFLFGPSYAAATDAVSVLLCIGLPVVFAIWILHAIAISVDRERLLLTTGLIGLAVNVGVNLYAIPHYGPNGAAFATVRRRNREHGRSRLRPACHAVKRTRRSLFVLLFASYAYFYQAGGWNQNSRFDLVRAITNEHTLNIDPFRARRRATRRSSTVITTLTRRRASRSRPCRSWRSFGPSCTRFGGDPETFAGLALLSYLSTVFTAGLFTALAGVCLFTLSRRARREHRRSALRRVDLRARDADLDARDDLHRSCICGGAPGVRVCGGLARRHDRSVSRSSPRRDGRPRRRVGDRVGISRGDSGDAARARRCVMHAWPLGRTRSIRVLGALTAGALASGRRVDGVSVRVLRIAVPHRVLERTGLRRHAAGRLRRHVAEDDSAPPDSLRRLPRAAAACADARGRADRIGAHADPPGRANRWAPRFAADGCAAAHCGDRRGCLSRCISCFSTPATPTGKAAGRTDRGTRRRRFRFSASALPRSGHRRRGSADGFLPAFPLTAWRSRSSPCRRCRCRRRTSSIRWPSSCGRRSATAIWRSTRRRWRRVASIWIFAGTTSRRAAFNLGMKVGLTGHASLVPLALVWAACIVALYEDRRTIGVLPGGRQTAS